MPETVRRARALAVLLGPGARLHYSLELGFLAGANPPGPRGFTPFHPDLVTNIRLLRNRHLPPEDWSPQFWSNLRRGVNSIRFFDADGSLQRHSGREETLDHVIVQVARDPQRLGVHALVHVLRDVLRPLRILQQLRIGRRERVPYGARCTSTVWPMMRN